MMSVPEIQERLAPPMRKGLLRSVVLFLGVSLVLMVATPSVSGAADAVPELKATSDKATPKAAVDLIKESYGKPLTVDELKKLRARLEILGEGTISIGAKPMATTSRVPTRRTRCIRYCYCRYYTSDGKVQATFRYAITCDEVCPVCKPAQYQRQQAPAP